RVLLQTELGHCRVRRHRRRVLDGQRLPPEDRRGPRPALALAGRHGARRSRHSRPRRRGERRGTAHRDRAGPVNARTETPRPSAPFWRERLLRLALAFGVLLLIALALSLWLLRTESGLRFVLARAVGATEGKLSVDRASGRLAGPVELSGVRYHDPAAGADVRVGNATVDFRFLELMAWRLHVTQLTLADLDVALTTVPKQPEPEPPAGEFSLAAPIDIVLDRLALERVR